MLGDGPEGRIQGFDTTVPKRSAVDVRGELRVDLIDGLRVRLTRPVPHEDGHLIEIARASWDTLGEPIVQVHMTTTFPGRVAGVGAPPTDHRPAVRGQRPRAHRLLRRPA